MTRPTARRWLARAWATPGDGPGAHHIRVWWETAPVTPGDGQFTMTNDDWDAVGFIVASDYRRDALEALADGPATPSVVGERAGYATTYISKSFAELREQGLIKLLVGEETQKGRIYTLTDDGEAAWELIDKHDP